MQNYERFKKEVERKLMDYAPDEWKDTTFEIRTCMKVGGEKEGLVVSHEGQSVAPIVYLDQMFKYFSENDEDFPATMENTWKIIVEASDNGAKFTDVAKTLFVRTDDIIMRVLNTEANKEYLEACPHREFLDMSIMYFKLIETNDEGTATCRITNEIAEKLGLDEEGLFKKAAENTARLLPAKVCTLLEVLTGIVSEETFTDDDNLPMYVITNDRNTFGAVTLFYDGVLAQLAEKMGCDLYILPSSVHEVMAISANQGKPNELIEMVKSINSSDVLPEEVLSNSVYKYHRNTGSLTFALDECEATV